MHVHTGGALHGAAALPFAAHPDGAATGEPLGAQGAAANQVNAAPLQHNGAAVAAEAVGHQVAAVADDAAHQAVQGLGRQHNHPIGGQHGLLVVNEGLDRGRGGADGGKVGRRVKAQGYGLTRGQGNGARLGKHHAVVAHLGRQQGNVAPRIGRQGAQVDHRRRAAVAVEVEQARQIIAVGDGARGGHQATHIDAGGAAKVNPVGVAQIHLPVAGDAAQHLAGVAADDAVQNAGIGTGQVEVDLRVGAYIERAPIHNALIAALVDVHHRADGGGAAI